MRVVVLYDADADAHQLGSSAANQAVVPWVKMHDPLQPIGLADDGSSTELSNMLVECHNLVHFNWGRDDGSQAQLLTRLKDIRASLILKTLHEGRGRGRCKLGGRQFTPVTLLNTVLLCDNLRDLSDLKSAIDQSLRIVLDQVLAESLRAQLQAWKVPSEPTVYRHRLWLDLCAMVFSRPVVFSESALWSCHLRADSSPQFGKDYLVVEADKVDLEAVSNSTTLMDMKHHVHRRILPLQLIGERAASAEQKSFRLTLALSADTPDTSMTLLRCSSLAFDMGVEAKLFVAPGGGPVIPPGVEAVVEAGSGSRATFQPLDLVLPTHVPAEADVIGSGSMEAVSRMCPKAMPIGDADHAMHHTMLEMNSAFSEWDFFHRSLHSISKYFSNWSRLRRFRDTCIERNPRFKSAALRQFFSSMFMTACPALVEHRWEYLRLN